MEEKSQKNEEFILYMILKFFSWKFPLSKWPFSGNWWKSYIGWIRKNPRIYPSKQFCDFPSTMTWKIHGLTRQRWTHFMKFPSKFQNANFGPKNVGKISPKLARQRLKCQRLTHFSSFEHTQNVSIFGEPLYIFVKSGLWAI